MERNINKFVTCVIVFWILVFIFQKEILSFIGGWGPSWFKDILTQIIGFMVLWAGKAWGLVKDIFNWLAGRVLKIVSNLDPFSSLAKSLGNLILGILKPILDFLAPFFSKIVTKQ